MSELKTICHFKDANLRVKHNPVYKHYPRSLNIYVMAGHSTLKTLGEYIFPQKLSRAMPSSTTRCCLSQPLHFPFTIQCTRALYL